MRFIDEARIRVVSGKGGNGCVSFRREKFVPMGGPDGGNGGRGGDVVLVATTRRNTLLDLRHKPLWSAGNGQNGQGAQKTGRTGDDLEIAVPVGTRIFDDVTGEVVGDLTDDEARIVVAEGGHGGRGNATFKSSTNRTPRQSSPGGEAVERDLRLELMLMADVGLLGFPNAGKSTLISRVSSARPRVADYPFTTLVPNLGVVDLGLDGSFVIADIPGLIQGASEGAGLGHQFLRHVQRCGLLLHLVSLGPWELEVPAIGQEADVDASDPGAVAIARYDAIRGELAAYDDELAARPELVALTKSDLVDADTAARAAAAMRAHLGDDRVMVVSSVSGSGIPELVRRLQHELGAKLRP